MRKGLSMHVQRFRHWLLTWAFFLPLLWNGQAQATIVVVDPLDVMTQKSEVVVHAVVYAQEVKTDSRGRIITLTLVEVLDGMKGASKGEQLIIYQVGGSLNGISQWIAGNHRFAAGEEFLLFGVRYENMIVSYGVGIGKFKVIRDETGVLVVEDVNDVVAAYRQQGGPMKMEPATPRVFTALDDFKELVRDIASVPAQPKLLTPNLKVINPKALKPLRQPMKPAQPMQPLSPTKL